MAGALNGKVALVGCYSPRPDEESRHSSAGRATDGLRDRTHTRSQRSEMDLEGIEPRPDHVPSQSTSRRETSLLKGLLACDNMATIC